MASNFEPDLESDDGTYTTYPLDGLPARVVGNWSEEKHYYLNHFINIFSTGMHKKWQARAYVDLFCGPGICSFRRTTRFSDGSPLIALKANHPFTQYHFADLDETATSTLKKRVAGLPGSPRVEIIQGDCNNVAAKINTQITSDCLSLAFLDPTNLALKFQTIEALSRGKPMDLLIHFPHGTAMKRNIEKFFAKDSSTMDDFFGGQEWRQIYEKRLKPIQVLADIQNPSAELLNLYRDKLSSIGYIMDPSQAILIRNSKNVPLYALIFATKHKRGMEFWKKVKQIEADGQRGLPGI